MAITSKVLSRISYFTGLSSAELESVKKRIAFEKKVEKGEIFLVEGEQSAYMYFIVSGAVKVYKKSVNKKEQILNVASTGESLNDVSTFDGGGCATDMLAMTPVHLYGIRKEDIRALVAENPQIALNAARVLASKVRRDSSLVEVLSFDLVISRLARFLLKQTAAGAQTLPLFTQQDLAAMVGTSRVVVNRSLRTMEEAGAIRLVRRRIVVTDEEALKALVK
jgi:CRP/FNR family cyclic AMP-dependent transcriptional regulator